MGAYSVIQIQAKLIGCYYAIPILNLNQKNSLGEKHVSKKALFVLWYQANLDGHCQNY